MNYDNTIMEILQKITISAVVVLMNCDKLTIKGKITGKNNLIGMKRLTLRYGGYASLFIPIRLFFPVILPFIVNLSQFISTTTALIVIFCNISIIVLS